MLRYAATVPHITIKTGFIRPDGQEEQLTEYICDVPGCPNVATYVLGQVRELHMARAVCNIHAPDSIFKAKPSQ
jgi:hypothetical protein